MGNPHGGLLCSLIRHGHLQVPFKMETEKFSGNQGIQKMQIRKASHTAIILILHQGPARGGPMSPVWILKCLVSVFINACRLLLALLSLSQFGRRRLSLVAISFYALLLLFGPCCLSEFTLAGPLHFIKNWWLKLNNIISIFKTCFGPESIDRNSNILKFFSHTKDTHRHSILCHCVS